MTDSHLALDFGGANPKFDGYLKASYRQLGFIIEPSELLEVWGYYACDESGNMQIILGTSAGAWCVAEDPIKNAYGLYVEDATATG